MKKKPKPFGSNFKDRAKMSSYISCKCREFNEEGEEVLKVVISPQCAELIGTNPIRYGKGKEMTAYVQRVPVSVDNSLENFNFTIVGKSANVLRLRYGV